MVDVDEMSDEEKRAVLRKAQEIARDWHDQDGINGKLLDDLTALFFNDVPDVYLRRIVEAGKRHTDEARAAFEHTFRGDGADCAMCGEGRQHYVHTDREREH